MKSKQTLGITGAGRVNEDIWEGNNKISNKSDEVKQICPWFFKLRDMVEDRFDDVGAAITSSETDVLLDAG